ncbi:MAG TPA: lipoyl synthase [bacterium]|nr:lipoyl synthase [bacterium]
MKKNIEDNQEKTFIRKPDWLKKEIVFSNGNSEMRKKLNSEKLNTVCESALCPNKNECYNKATATFMILGNICTRNCLFCNVNKGTPDFFEFDREINKIIELANYYNYKYVNITSVTRDDLDDYGIDSFCEIAINLKKTNILTEILIPDLMNKIYLVDKLIAAQPAVINHNIEMVERLYPEIRSKSNFQTSIELLKYLKEKKVITKTGFMVGLGETEAERYELIDLLAELKIDILTIGQYLQPSLKHYPIKEYLSPYEFEKLKKYAENTGISVVESGVFVRSSYRSYETYNKYKLFKTENCSRIQTSNEK